MAHDSTDPAGCPGVQGDLVTYTAIINACAKRSDASGAVKWLHRIVELWRHCSLTPYVASDCMAGH